MTARWSPPLTLVAALAVSGCALTSKADPVELRYFSAEAAAAKPLEGAHGSLELRRVVGAAHLTPRMLRRVSAQELVYSETDRWSEEPAEYLRRGLERALFEGGALARLQGGDGPSLDVELTAFEAVGEAPGKARVALRAFLYRGRESRLFREVTVEQPVAAPGDPAGVAAAVGAALAEAIERLRGELGGALAKGR